MEHVVSTLSAVLLTGKHSVRALLDSLEMLVRNVNQCKKIAAHKIPAEKIRSVVRMPTDTSALASLVAWAIQNRVAYAKANRRTNAVISGVERMPFVV